jgi:HAMP domain-containing protein
VQEAEALPTNVLRDEIEAALRDTLNMDLFDEVASDKQDEIDALAQEIRRLRP